MNRTWTSALSLLSNLLVSVGDLRDRDDGLWIQLKYFAASREMREGATGKDPDPCSSRQEKLNPSHTSSHFTST
jgi:hypothetical protein